jgi:hypothetical protein
MWRTRRGFRNSGQEPIHLRSEARGHCPSRGSIRCLDRIVVFAFAAIQAARTALDFFGRQPLRVVNGLGVAATARFSFHGSSIARPLARNEEKSRPCRIAKKLRRRAHSRIPLRLNKNSQPLENRVPLRGNLAQIAACLLQPPLLQSPHPLSAAPRAAHQPGAFHHSEVLGHSLPANSSSASQLRYRSRSAVTQPGDQPQTFLVSQRCE